MSWMTLGCPEDILVLFGIQPAAVLLDGSLNTIKLNILLVKLDDARVTLCRNAAIRRCYTNLTVARARENPTHLGTLPYPIHG